MWGATAACAGRALMRWCTPPLLRSAALCRLAAAAGTAASSGCLGNDRFGCALRRAVRGRTHFGRARFAAAFGGLRFRARCLRAGGLHRSVRPGVDVVSFRAERARNIARIQFPRRAIELALQRTDHATKGFCRSNEQRIVRSRTLPPRRQCLSLPHHSKLLLAGPRGTASSRSGRPVPSISLRASDGPTPSPGVRNISPQAVASPKIR